MFELNAIGYVRSTRAEAHDDRWGQERVSITLVESFPPDALQGLGAFSHAEILFLFHRVDPAGVTVGARHPRNNPAWPRVGIFAQRGKNRPNRIGSTVCRIDRIEGRTLFLRDLDAIDGTPVLDIKPVMREFLPRDAVEQPEWATELMRDYWD